MFTIAVLLSGAVVGLALFFIVLLLPYSSKYYFQNPPSEKETIPIQILVLGDIGRSPRMQYHAISAGKHGARVEIIGYRESELHPDLVANPLISVVPLPAFPSFLRTDSKILFLVLGPLKVLWQFWSLWWTLGYRTQPARWLMVQNPPSIPTLAVAALISARRGSFLLIDWHNYGWTILALKLGPTHILVRIAKWYEEFFGRLAHNHFTVTHALGQQLKHNLNVRMILTVHDRPAQHFQPLSPEQREAFLHRCPVTTGYASSIIEGKTKVLVSPTSWTPDEDFSLLLKALVMYARDRSANTPSVLAIITGKGPQKQHYIDEIRRLTEEGQLTNVTILTAWLSTQDYASLLGAADLGVSLHKSSSGLDLPMKVVDMFGAGLPVVGWDQYEAWKELVTQGVNGLGFDSAEKLGWMLLKVFEDERRLRRIKHGALQEGCNRWDDEWDVLAGNLMGITQLARDPLLPWE